MLQFTTGTSRLPPQGFKVFIFSIFISFRSTSISFIYSLNHYFLLFHSNLSLILSILLTFISLSSHLFKRLFNQTMVTIEDLTSNLSPKWILSSQELILASTSCYFFYSSVFYLWRQGWMSEKFQFLFCLFVELIFLSMIHLRNWKLILV